MKRTLALACLAIFIPFASAYADQGGFANSGGSLSGGSSVANPPGTLTIAGGTLTFRSTDGMTAIDAGFSSSSTVERCSGGGRGGHVTCGFTFRGSFSGTLTANGATQAINGSTYQLYGTDGVVVAGTTGFNSAYTPFYFSNTGQLRHLWFGYRAIQQSFGRQHRCCRRDLRDGHGQCPAGANGRYERHELDHFQRDRVRRRPIRAIRRARCVRRERADLRRGYREQAERSHGRHERRQLGHIDAVPGHQQLHLLLRISHWGCRGCGRQDLRRRLVLGGSRRRYEGERLVVRKPGLQCLC